MTRFFADENFSGPVVRILRDAGRDVRTVQEVGMRGAGDPAVLDRATLDGRAVLTGNRGDYIALHHERPDHAGIVVCTHNADVPDLARRIVDTVAANEPVAGKLVRVYKRDKTARPGRR